MLGLILSIIGEKEITVLPYKACGMTFGIGFSIMAILLKDMTKQLKQEVKNSTLKGVFEEMDRQWEDFKKDSNKFIKKLKKQKGEK